MNLSEKQKMLAGQLYHAGCPELQAEQIANKHWMQRYNDSADLLNEQRHAMLGVMVLRMAETVRALACKQLGQRLLRSRQHMNRVMRAVAEHGQ